MYRRGSEAAARSGEGRRDDAGADADSMRVLLLDFFILDTPIFLWVCGGGRYRYQYGKLGPPAHAWWAAHRLATARVAEPTP